jgi:fluoroacetyl-CoA thioesterase
VKLGLAVGTEATVEDVVTSEMRPAFGGQVVHPVYGTSAMVYHMEWAARRVILPYLEDDEEGVGTGVMVRHLHPAPVGAIISARATCTRFEQNIVVCSVQVWQGEQLLGDGEVEQRILSRASLHDMFTELWAQELANES